MLNHVANQHQEFCQHVLRCTRWLLGQCMTSWLTSLMHVNRNWLIFAATLGIITICGYLICARSVIVLCFSILYFRHTAFYFVTLCVYNTVRWQMLICLFVDSFILWLCTKVLQSYSVSICPKPVSYVNYYCHYFMCENRIRVLSECLNNIYFAQGKCQH